MRYAILMLLSGCSLYFTGNGSGSSSGSSSDPPNTYNSCPFGEGETAVACQGAASCGIETWEHGCSCSCHSDGWWYCTEETVGSRCPQGAPQTGGNDPLTPDALIIDAAPCSRIEAESIGEYPGWTLLYGSLSGDLGLSALGTTPLLFNFTGTTLGIDHEVGPGRAPIEVSIDGAAPIEITGLSDAFVFQDRQVASGLANELHHVSVVCDGSGCAIDYFDVSCD